MSLIKELHSAYIDFRKMQRIRKHMSMSQDEYPRAVERLYTQYTGKVIDINNPRTFNEKIQWTKIWGIEPRMTQLADKYAVRGWIKDTIGEKYLIPLVDYWDNVNDIDWDKLPDSFVLKMNNASGENIVVTDKSSINIESLNRKLKRWLKINYGFITFELQYKDIKPLIIAEKYMVLDGNSDLPDYKFYCFDGKVFCSYITTGGIHLRNMKLSFYDRDWRLLPYSRSDHEPERTPLPKPKNYENMLEIAELLSEGFPHVRVDLYNLNGSIYFGEMTFTTSSGYCQYQPEEFDYILGSLWNIRGGGV